MKIDWTPLRRTLSEMRGTKMTLPLWWRDDDAIAATPELEQLADIGTQLGIPIHIAVIPDLAEASLPQVFKTRRDLVPLVHGWRHQRHFLKGKKDTEFGIRRPNDTKETELALARMRTLFSDLLLPVFVPPWNMIAESLLPILADQGYVGVSTFTPRQTRFAANGLVQINTHLDPIDWRGTRGLVDPAQLVERLCNTIRCRMSGEHDRTEPLGYLTHHLVHTEDIWDFSRQCLEELLQGGADPIDLRNFKGALP